MPLIFNEYQIGNYNKAVEGIGSILNQVVIDILTVEGVDEIHQETVKNLEYLEKAKIYPEAITNDIAMIIHGAESASKDNTITEQDFLTQLESLHDVLAFLTNIYENAHVKYWDVQLAYKSSADKDNLFKQRDIKNKLPESKDKINDNLDLDFNSKVVKKAKPAPVKATKEKVEEHKKAPKPKLKEEKAKKQVQPIEKTKVITKPKVEKKPVIKKPKKKVVSIKADSRTARKKARSKKKRNRLLTMVAVAAVVIAGGIGIGHAINANTQSKTVVSDMKPNKKAKKRSKAEVAKKLKDKKLKLKKDKELKLKKEKELKKKQMIKSNWLAGKIYQLSIATKEITGTVNNSSEQSLALPNPRLSKPTYIVFNPDASQRTFVKVNSLQLAKKTTRQKAFDSLDAKQRNANFELKNNTLTAELPNLDWAYPLSPYNAIQLSKQGRKTINSIFSNVLTNIKLNKKSGQNNFKLNKKLKGKDFTNTTGDIYHANYQIQVQFKKVK